MWEDWDLDACLDNNDIGLTPKDITAILAVWEGENDGDHWRWIVSLADGRFAFIEGWCDYTGWDCQSSADVGYAESPEGTLDLVGNLPDWTYLTNAETVRASLKDQLANGKKKTWREETDEKFGITSKYLPESER